MHKYEVMFIIRPDTPEEEVEKLVSLMEGFVTGAGGKMEKIEKLGRRRLAYRVERQREGFYVLFVFEGVHATVNELERRMRVTDAVIKFLTVRIDEEQKRAAKLAKARAEKQAKRPKASTQPPPDVAPIPAAPTGEPEATQA
ncbi:MAG TPA: 30S ribosomal protein S6 [Terriglobia bacterium]|nr:30S ribosomal protein S6 [Terriglobia bacterium]